MALYKDQMNRAVRCMAQPQRIVSLVPSQTELLHYLGLGEVVVGITKFCIHPDAWYKSKKRVGGTKDVSINAVDELQPDLIIANKEENARPVIEKLAQKYPVWISDIYDLPDAYGMMHSIGDITDKRAEATALVEQLRTELYEQESPLPKVLYCIWRKPWMFAGDNVFINTMLRCAGFENILCNHSMMQDLEVQKRNTRYPALDEVQIKELAPDYVMLSSEPFPFKEKHIEEMNQLLPDTEIILVDGEVFTWYGSRLLLAKKYFDKLRNHLALPPNPAKD